VVLWGDSYEEAHEYGQRLAQERGLTLIHAFDDEEIIAGQGTVGLEICDALDQLDMVLVPVGGGGLIAGVALAVRALHPRASVKGVQAEVAPACAVSLRRGRRLTVKASPTIADGIAVARPGQLTFRIIRELVDEIVTVSEEEIAHAMVMLLERAKLLVEGAGAVGLAALLSGRVQCRGRRAVVILSGGNIDPNLLTRVLGHGLAHAGRYLVLRVVLMDRPGRLARLLEVIARADANVLEVNHHRHGLHLPMGQVQVEVTVETRDAEHATYVAQQLEEGGYLPVQVPPSTQPPSILSFVSRDVLTQPQ
jgi:threonine dehydratase